MTKRSPFKWLKTCPEIIRLAVMMYIRFPPTLRNVEDLLHERGVGISHETIRYSDNYLIDTDYSVIVGVEATRSVRQAEVGAPRPC